ncbi:MAG: pilus assembly protein PilZ [Sulfitobacter sp.]
MSSKDVEENLPTPENVAKIATQTATLSRIALIGVFGSEANLNALVRENNGDFARVAVGDRFNGGVVAAIGKDRLVLNRNGKSKVMKLPQG